MYLAYILHTFCQETTYFCPIGKKPLPSHFIVDIKYIIQIFIQFLLLCQVFDFDGFETIWENNDCISIVFNCFFKALYNLVSHIFQKWLSQWKNGPDVSCIPADSCSLFFKYHSRSGPEWPRSVKERRRDVLRRLQTEILLILVFHMHFYVKSFY